ncbi:MAG: DUF3853 family protein [Bacteroidales bacterium]|nr:DUF3853 family protein [Bacteroidales bacterium]
MEILTAEYKAHLEEVARKAGAEEAMKVLEEQMDGQTQKRKKHLVPVKQLSKEIGVSVPTLIRHRNNGLIEGFRFGGRILYDVDQVLGEMQSTLRIKKKGPHND